MSALTNFRSTTKMNSDQVLANLISIGVKATYKCYEGGVVVIQPGTGYARPGYLATGLSVLGIAEATADNSASGATDGLVNCAVRAGIFYLANDGTIGQAQMFQPCYLLDDQTVSANDQAGQASQAGTVMGFDSGGVWVLLGMSFAQVAGSAYATPQGKARCMCVLPDAYGGTGTGVLTETTASSGLGVQNGVTLAAGNVVFIEAGSANLSAAADAGPWVVTTVGSASVQWVLTRPDWYANGSTITQSMTIDISGDDNKYGGRTFKAFCAAAQVVGTNDAKFYVGRITVQVTLVASTYTLNTIGIRSATESAIACQLAGGTPLAGTVGYGTIAAMTPGYAGTGSAVIDALAANMTKNGTTDVSVLNVTVTNW